MLRELEDRKRAAVAGEDYDAAKSLKVEIERLRLSIERPQVQSGGSQGSGSRASPIQPLIGGDLGAPVSDHRTRRGAHPAALQPQTLPSSGDEHYNGYGPVHTPIAAHLGNGMDRSDLFGAPAAPPAFAQNTPSAKGTPSGGGGMPFREQAGSPPLPANAARAKRSPSPADGDMPGGGGPSSVRQPSPQTERGFDAATHLSGVANVEDLSQPEPLTANVEKEAEPLVHLFGQYVTCCAFSKTWNLRDAALQKLALDLSKGVYAEQDPKQLLHALVTVLKRAIPDKNVQVFLSGAALLQVMCSRLLSRGSLKKQEAQASLESLMLLLVDRLGDVNARVDKTARDAHLDLARCSSVGALFTAQHLLRSPKKKTVPPRVFASRLQLLTALVAEAGLQPESREGLPLEPTMQLAMEWFNNPSSEVRESAVRLVAACYTQSGLPRIEKFLANLRPAQREVFDAEFDRMDNGDIGGPAGHMPPPQVPPRRQEHAAEPMHSQAEDEHSCQFCGRYNPAFTQETVDVHYWRECPMLRQCEFCQQVIEIATMQSHLAEECEAGEAARDAARELQLGCCPLCNVQVGRGDADWKDHLITKGCTANPRNAFREGLV